MPLTNCQTTTFFENNAQMDIPTATRAQLIAEGLEDVEDLSDFDKASLKLLAENIHRPRGMIPNPDPNAPPGTMIQPPPFVFGAKSQLHLKGAMRLVKYYQTVGRPLTVANIQWNPIIKLFMEHWKELMDCKDADTPSIPKITKTLVVTKWMEAFQDFLHQVVGACYIPLA